MKRTERLQALIDQLRAAGPDPTPARVLADRFEVSTRTIERDLSALQRAGEPITSVPGPGGGFTLESSRSLPPVRLTPAEAIATVAALTDDTGPFAPAAGRAREKLLAAMVDRDLELPGEIARRIRRDRTDQVTPVPAVSLALQVGMGRHEVISVRHREDGGGEAVALVEPVAVVEVDSVWHLLAWCRHHDAPWTCRIDRVGEVELTGEVVPARDPADVLALVPGLACGGDAAPHAGHRTPTDADIADGPRQETDADIADGPRQETDADIADGPRHGG